MGDHKWIVAFFEELGTPLLRSLPVGGLGDRYRGELLPGALRVRHPAAGRGADLGRVRVPAPGRIEAVRTSVGRRARVARRLSGRRETMEELRARIENPDDEAARSRER